VTTEYYLHKASTTRGYITSTQGSRLLLAWHYDYTTILSYLFPSSPGREIILPLAKKPKHISTYLHFLQTNYSTKINKIKIGSTLLGDIPSEVVIYVAVISEIKLLISVDSQIYVHHRALIFFLGKGGKV